MSFSEGPGSHAQYTQERANDKPCQFCTNSGNKKRKKKYLKNLPLRNRRFFPHFFFYTRGTVLGRASRCSERDRKPNNVLISELHEVQRTSPVRATLQQHPARRPPNYGVAYWFIISINQLIDFIYSFVLFYFIFSDSSMLCPLSGHTVQGYLTALGLDF